MITASIGGFKRIVRKIRSGKILNKIDFDSGSFVQAVMEGKQIRKARYDMYHLIEDVFWGGDVKNPAQPRQWVISG
jgi:hypothetical protein